MPCDLFTAVQHRDQVQITDQIGVAVHMARKDVDGCIRSGCLPNSGAFFGGSYEKFACTGGGQCGGNAVRRQPIAICLNHGAGFGGSHGGQ